MRKRNRQILLSLSDREFMKLEKGRKTACMTRQAYLLDLVHRLPPVRCPKPDLAKHQAILDDDGRRINDMARSFNATDQIDMAEYASAVNDLYRHMTQLEEEIRRINDEQTENKTQGADPVYRGRIFPGEGECSHVPAFDPGLFSETDPGDPPHGDAGG